MRTHLRTALQPTPSGLLVVSEPWQIRPTSSLDFRPSGMGAATREAGVYFGVVPSHCAIFRHASRVPLARTLLVWKPWTTQFQCILCFASLLGEDGAWNANGPGE